MGARSWTMLQEGLVPTKGANKKRVYDFDQCKRQAKSFFTIGLFVQSIPRVPPCTDQDSVNCS